MTPCGEKEREMIFMFDLVYQSVTEMNRRNAGIAKKINKLCPRCGIDLWYVRYGVDPQYRSQFNPGEYVAFTCACCGYQEEHQC